MFLKEFLLLIASGTFSTAYPTDATIEATGTDKLICLYLLMLETAIISLFIHARAPSGGVIDGSNNFLHLVVILTSAALPASLACW
ncbi:unnamed protein product [Gongylonema pulchrum]|uniref:Secreted protein n=1 Tax=Gongylonema pulchrum TaxID=637853 RepID=A0A183DAK2_9BILA|nr:unnamed protein product [Gongylonema pulchrum]